MQDEQGDERRASRADSEGGGKPENFDLLQKCVQTYRVVTTLRASNRKTELDYVT
jgi:hypothetical protein